VYGTVLRNAVVMPLIKVNVKHWILGTRCQYSATQLGSLKGAPAHDALHYEVSLASSRSLAGTEDVILVVIVLARGTNFAKTLVFSFLSSADLTERERSTGPWLKRLKGLDIYIPPLLTLNDQQRFTIRSGVLTGNDTRWCSASSGSPLLERTDFGTRSLQLDGPTYAPASRTMAFTPQC